MHQTTIATKAATDSIRSDLRVDLIRRWLCPALQAASLKGYQEIVKLLSDKGAYVNAQSGEFGNTLQAALQAALFKGHQENAQQLQRSGASTSSLKRSSLDDSKKPSEETLSYGF